MRPFETDAHPAARPVRVDISCVNRQLERSQQAHEALATGGGQSSRARLRPPHRFAFLSPTLGTPASRTDSVPGFARRRRLRAAPGNECTRRSAARSLHHGAAPGRCQRWRLRLRNLSSAHFKAQAQSSSARRLLPPPSAARWTLIADFNAPAIKLVVEVDGSIHARKRSADARRDLKLRRAGFRIIRVSAELVLRDLTAALALVRAALCPAMIQR